MTLAASQTNVLHDAHLAAFTIHQAAADGRMDEAYELATGLLDRLTRALTELGEFGREAS